MAAGSVGQAGTLFQLIAYLDQIRSYIVAKTGTKALRHLMPDADFVLPSHEPKLRYQDYVVPAREINGVTV